MNTPRTLGLISAVSRGAPATTARLTFRPLRFMSTSPKIMSNTPNPIPASFLRGGTSKGIFLNRLTLPEDQAQWDPIFLGIMGSPDPDNGRQLNGMGGGISSLSKICVVGAPTPSQKDRGIDVEYTFAQVGIRDSSIDYSGNCGNLSSMIGAFAVDQGICTPRTLGTHATVRSFNTNTQKIIDTTFPISTSTKSEQLRAALDNPETSMAGVSGMASTIMMEFVSPAGARTGRLLPTGSPHDNLTILPPGNDERSVRCSCVDAANPTVFVNYSDLSKFLPIDDYLQGKPTSVGETLECIRQAAAVKMGLSTSSKAQPKIAILRSPHTEDDRVQGVDIVIYALSMGDLHKAVPITVGLCAGVASNVAHTLAWDILQGQPERQRMGMVRLRHPGGLVDVGAQFLDDGTVQSAKVVRTGRRLMEGVVWW